MNEHNKISVSVIVAVYNRENLLSRCVNSLVGQTLQSMEILLIDDQSTDGSWELMQRLHQEHPDRIRIFQNQKNLGCAGTQNVGIPLSRGEYLAFVDSDDYVEVSHFERLYAAAQNQKPEMVISPIWRISQNGKSVIAEVNPRIPGSEPDIADYLSGDFYYLHGKLFRRDLFRRFGVFPDLKIGCDVAWVFPTISHLRKIVYVPQPGHYYELSSNSITGNTESVQIALDIVAGSKRIVSAAAPEYREYALLYAVRRILGLGEKRPQFAKVFKNAVMEYADEFMHSAYISKSAPAVVKKVKRQMEEYASMDPCKVSIVVAVYNREDLLGRCVDSLVNQTLEGIEVILVDDQSTDGSWELMQQLQVRYPDKIRIFKNLNKGVAHTKNLGIQMARGEYLALVDSDDYVDVSLFERLYAAAQDKKPEMVVSPIWRVSQKGKSVIAEVNSRIPGGEPDIADYLSGDFYYLHGKLFRRDLFQRFGVFPDLKMGSDVAWVFPMISHLREIVYVPQPGHYYELSSNSITGNTESVQVVLDIVAGSKRIVSSTASEYREYALLYAVKRMLALGEKRPQFAAIFMDAIMEYADEFLHSAYISKSAPTIVKKVKKQMEEYANMSPCKVSVVVAVYNREDLLGRCVDSLVNQTLEEIEVILVDDQSTDGSWELMQQLQARYPDKIRIFKNTNKGVAHTKNLGIQLARGEYISFVDSDDYIDYKMLNRMYTAAEETKPEMVVSPIWRVNNRALSQLGVIKPQEGEAESLCIADYLANPFFFLVGKLIRKDLFERFGLLPVLGIGEDAAWVFPVLSYVQTILYVPEPGYYYDYSNNSVTKDIMSTELMRDIVLGSRRALEMTNPEYRDYALKYAVERLIGLGGKRPLYSDFFMQALDEYAEEVCQSEFIAEKAPKVLNAVEKYLQVKESVIPHRVYLNGFSGTEMDAEIERFAAAFREGAEVVVLSEQNCDVHSLPLIEQAYQAGQLDFVGKYFALKACVEQGGIYLDCSLALDAPLNALTYDQAVFAFETGDELTERVFGGCKGNQVLQEILDTYRFPDLYEDQFAPLKNRMKTILIGLRGLNTQNTVDRREVSDFAVYPISAFICAMPESGGVQFAHVPVITDAMALAPWAQMQALIDARMKSQSWAANKKYGTLSRSYNRIKKVADKRSDYIVKLEERFENLHGIAERRSGYIQWLEQEKAAMQNTFSWKITRPVRAVGKILRKIRAKLHLG